MLQKLYLVKDEDDIDDVGSPSIYGVFRSRDLAEAIVNNLEEADAEYEKDHSNMIRGTYVILELVLDQPTDIYYLMMDWPY